MAMGPVAMLALLVPTLALGAPHGLHRKVVYEARLLLNVKHASSLGIVFEPELLRTAQQVE